MLRLATLDTRPLRRHPDFRLLYIGQGVAFFGSMVASGAAPYHVPHLTHPPLALGGVMIALLGLPVTYGAEVFGFAFSLLMLWLMRAAPPPTGAEPPSLRRIAEGLRYARSRQELIGTYAVDMVAMFFGMPMALFPAIAEHLGGPRTLGLLFAAPAVGSLIAPATRGWASRVPRP